MSSYYPTKRKAPESYTTEFDIIKASHKFLRSGEEDVSTSWDTQLAKKYEDSLFKEFAVCDLKHYKSGNIALRWRTEDEVLSGAGQESCGNSRCPNYDAPRGSGAVSTDPSDTHGKSPKPPKLTTMELPFSYVERGETKVREVMVKVVLCERCVRKLMWKREKDKRQRLEPAGQTSGRSSGEVSEGPSLATEKADRKLKKLRDQKRNERRSGKEDHSRSRSPRRHRER